LLPNNIILREVKNIPTYENSEIDKNMFVGIYIENPIVNSEGSELNYTTCPEEKAGQSILGTYHLFTYSNFCNCLISDLIIPKSTNYSDYNSSLSVQKIIMPWKNTKINNFYYFNGKEPKEDKKYNLEISSLINFNDYNGDGYPGEFILFGGEYLACGHDERLIAGFDTENSNAIIYKIIDKEGKIIYWSDNFIPKKDGSVLVSWLCGDHGADTETNSYYIFNKEKKSYLLIKEEEKKCEY